MKLVKQLIIISSAIGIYHAVKKIKNKRKPVRKKITKDKTVYVEKYNHMKPEQVREQFKKFIAEGEWLSLEEYEEMMKAMKRKN